MNILIIGGSSGLGLELAQKLKIDGLNVYITGRKNPGVKDLDFKELDLSTSNLSEKSKQLIDELPNINTLIYCAGYFQEGTLTDLSEDQIEEMINVGGRGLIYICRSILLKQKNLP